MTFPQLPDEPMMHAPAAEKSYSPTLAWFHSAVWSLYEVGFALLPGLVWLLVLVVLRKTEAELLHLTAWSFISVSVYASMLRDSVRTFSRANTARLRNDRDVSVIFGLTGVVLSSVLLAIGVCRAQGAISELPEIYDIIVLGMLATGVGALFVIKTIAIRHTEYKPPA